MKNYFIEELKRAFFSKVTLFSSVLSILLFFGGFIEYIGWLTSDAVSVFYLFISGYNSGISNMMVIVFPIVACLPFASSYVKDCKTGLTKYLYIRMDKKMYLGIRFIVNGLVGGFVLFIGPFVGFIFLLAAKLLVGTSMNGVTTDTYDYYREIGFSSPLIIMIFILIAVFCCGFVIASFSLATSIFIQNPYIVIILPFVFYLFSATILLDIFPSLNLLHLYDLSLYEGEIKYSILYGLVLLFVSLISFLVVGGKRIEEHIS